MEIAQITWEHEHLLAADAFAFFFAPETLCPITLFELGKVLSEEGKDIFVACDPGYARKRDVEIQLSLARGDVKVVSTIEEMVKQIIDWETDFFS